MYFFEMLMELQKRLGLEPTNFAFERLSILHPRLDRSADLTHFRFKSVFYMCLGRCNTREDTQAVETLIRDNTLREEIGAIVAVHLVSDKALPSYETAFAPRPICL